MGKFAWKRAGVALLPDKRSDAERMRTRTRTHHLRRPVCPDCAKEGAKSKAQTETWCDGLCKKHARKHGLTPPPKKACKPNATEKEAKLMQDRFGAELKLAKKEEPEEKEHQEGASQVASQVIGSWFDAAPHSNEDDDVDFAVVCAALSTPGKARIGELARSQHHLQDVRMNKCMHLPHQREGLPFTTISSDMCYLLCEPLRLAAWRQFERNQLAVAQRGGVPLPCSRCGGASHDMLELCPAVSGSDSE